MNRTVTCIRPTILISTLSLPYTEMALFPVATNEVSSDAQENHQQSNIFYFCTADCRFSAQRLVL